MDFDEWLDEVGELLDIDPYELESEVWYNYWEDDLSPEEAIEENNDL